MRAQESDVRTFLEKVAPVSGLESAGGIDSALELATPPPDRLAGPAEKAVEKTRNNRPLNPDEQFALEAIIIPDKRPAIRILNGDFKIVHPMWLHFNNAPIKDSIRRALPLVGRIDLPMHPNLPYGGTAFVVGDNLLMTNRHVAEIFTSGLGIRQLVFQKAFGTGVDFKREEPDEAASLLDVRDVLMVHPYWDMALLRVDGFARGVSLTLSLRDPDDLKNCDVAVVGYPAFDPRNAVDVQNQVFEGVFNVKRLQPGKVGPRENVESFGKSVSALTHDSSTLGGNSGSLVFDPSTGEVIALHFAGRYLKANYCVPTAELGRDGRVIDAGVKFSGMPKREATPWDSYWKTADPEDEAGEGRPSSSVPALVQAPTSTPAPAPAQGQAAAATGGVLAVGNGAVTLTIPLEISVRLGGDRATQIAASAAEAAIEKMVQPIHDSDLSTRTGFDENFLGVRVSLPTLVDEKVAALTKSGGRVLKYHHFSVVMHKARRLALFAASNLNDSKAARRPEPGRDYSRKGLTGLGKNDIEEWFADPRIGERHQLPDRFFTKDNAAFDKGHIVRREDVTWGKTYKEIVAANGDTYHTTNCSPQVASFNRSNLGDDNWGDLENYVKQQSNTELLSVLAGPVLLKDDQIFVGVDGKGPVRIQIPQHYWKVILAAENGKLQSFAFLLEQDLSDTPLELAVDAVWQRFMVPIADLEEMLMIRFPKVVHDSDQIGTAAGEGVRSGSGTRTRKKKR